MNEQDINEAENEIDGDEDGGMEENEAGEMVPRRKVISGPWKVVHQPQNQEDVTSVGKSYLFNWLSRKF